MSSANKVSEKVTRIILSIAFIVGGTSAIISILTNEQIFSYIVAISAITGGIAIMFGGISWLKKSRNN